MKKLYVKTTVVTMITSTGNIVRIESEAHGKSIYQYTVSAQKEGSPDKFIVSIEGEFGDAFRDAREFVAVSEQRGFKRALQLIVGVDFREFLL